MPIPLSMAVVIYITIWWIVLFTVLPWGIRTQNDEGEVVPGTEPGAPTAPKLLVKALWTTAVSVVVFVFVLLLYTYLD